MKIIKMKIIRKLALSKLLFIALLVIVLFTCFTYTVHANSKSKNIISDTNITASIKGKYLLDEKVSALDISVKTIDGKVYLKGKIPDAETGNRAISIAKNTNGVKAVVYELEDTWRASKEQSTAGHLLSDSAITTKIKGKYAVDEKISALDISVKTINGKVYLKGKVSDLDTANRAISIAQDTNGVKEVIYKLDLDFY